jgi:two-component system CheB/CheR fusion protein
MSNLGFNVAAIGASAGGLKPLKLFFKHLPAALDIPFVVILHLPKYHKTNLPQILSTCIDRPITLLESEEILQRNHVYILPGHLQAEISDGALHMSPRIRGPINRVIDNFFVSLAKDQTNKAIGIILSGAGMDGAIGMNAIYKNGGHTFVQDPSTSDHSSMPESAIAADNPYCVRIETMGDKLLELVGRVNT